MVGIVRPLALCLLVVTTTVWGEPRKNVGLFPNRMCWRPAGNTVDLVFNPSLATELENPNNLMPPHPSSGTANDRIGATREAVAAWNAALTAVGAPFQIRLVVNNRNQVFAARQGNSHCIDPIHNVPVYRADYTQHSGDNRNAGSTGEGNISGPRNNLGPGWVEGGNPVSIAIDQRLAETALIPPPNDPVARQIREADILWFTHFIEGRQCPVIRWNYQYVAAGPMGNPYYDFYSVMLHEIGHYLGLDHQSCPQAMPGNRRDQNVMEDSIAPGVRARILVCEMASLAQLYGRGTPCGAPAVMPAAAQ